MKSKCVSLYVLALVLLVFPACKQKDGPPVKEESLLATVNGVAITEDDLYLKLQGGHAVSMTPEVRQRALEELITEELLYQKGLKIGLDKDVKYQNAVRVMEQRMKAIKRAEMARQIRNTQIAATVAITQEDVKKYYDAHEAAISTDLHLLGIQFPDETQAKAAYERIKGGAAFETIAREKFAHLPKGKTVAWDMGFLHWNQIPIEWTDAISELKKGEPSNVLSSKRSGIYIMKVVDRRANPDAALGRMGASIMNRLQDLRIMEAYDHYVEQLKREARIVKPEERRKPS
jgi:parvulin-like peptidyl-prolyl isomerase